MYKKIVLVFIFSILFQILKSEKLKKIYYFELKQEISAPALRVVQKAMQEASLWNADIIIVDIDTYGGRVDIADSIRTRFLRSLIPIYVLINNNAASAGALISIACEKIFMTPGSTIGAATVVNQSGQTVPDKYQSYMRQKMRATAEERGRNPNIAEAMVDPDKFIKGISDSGKVLTFTTKEAIKNGFCDGVFKNYKEIIKTLIKEKTEIKKYTPTNIDKLISWIISPTISGILILLIMGGIYFELQTPGIGFPIAIACTAAILFFTPYYIEGIAEYWELILFFVGLILIGIEIFVIPGFGITGISGIICLLTGLTLIMIENNGFNFEFVGIEKVLQSFMVVIISGIIGIISIILITVNLLTTNLFEKLSLKTTQLKTDGYATNSNLTKWIGRKGITKTPLHPSGTILVDDEYLDAISTGGYIEKGKMIKILRITNSQLEVLEIEN